jgi:hypothetical protein
MAQTNGVVAEQDLQGLIQQMSLDEKISMLAGKSVWETANIDRLGIPSLKVSSAFIIMPARSGLPATCHVSLHVFTWPPLSYLSIGCVYWCIKFSNM